MEAGGRSGVGRGGGGQKWSVTWRRGGGGRSGV